MPTAKSASEGAAQAKLNALEAELAQSRNGMKLGYTDPDTGAFVAASSVLLRNLARTSPDERLRKACYEARSSAYDFSPWPHARLCMLHAEQHRRQARRGSFSFMSPRPRAPLRMRMRMRMHCTLSKAACPGHTQPCRTSISSCASDAACKSLLPSRVHMLCTLWLRRERRAARVSEAGRSAGARSVQRHAACLQTRLKQERV